MNIKNMMKDACSIKVVRKKLDYNQMARKLLKGSQFDKMCQLRLYQTISEHLNSNHLCHGTVAGIHGH